jgi:glutathione S-transferase
MTLSLIGHYDSPFVRRVGISLHLLGMPFERQLLSVFGDADEAACVQSGRPRPGACTR